MINLAEESIKSPLLTVIQTRKTSIWRVPADTAKTLPCNYAVWERLFRHYANIEEETLSKYIRPYLLTIELVRSRFMVQFYDLL